MNEEVSIKTFGPRAVLVTWKPSIDLDSHTKVIGLNSVICAQFKDIVSETVPAYHSILVQLTHAQHQEELMFGLKGLISREINSTSQICHLFHIPVCYEGDFGVDIETLALEKKLTISQVIQLHTKPIYPVYFIGFLPGFPYLGGLDVALHTARKKEPRSRIAAGSVGIGGSQTGIYPMESPGGWNLIGRTPLRLFQPNLERPALLKAGDRVQFYAIDSNEFEEISEAIEHRNFVIQKEVWDD